jgi:murein DD-endopeptidase MepM/ murein hydrolase activator NlpD
MKGRRESMRSVRPYTVAVVLVMAALLGAVSLAWGDPGATNSTRSSAVNPQPFQVGGGGAKHTPQGKQTPLLMRVLDAPEPVKGTDGKYHLVYELVLTNSSPGTATVESVKTIDTESGEVVDSLAGADVAARTVLLGNISGGTDEKIGTAQVALLFLDVTFEDLRDVPRAVEHRVTTSFHILPGFGSNLFPAETTDTGGGTGVLNKKPVVVGPPLEGKNWVVGNGCCNVSPHRGAMIAFDQRLEAQERYAIDWIQADEEGHIVLPDANHTKLADFPAYGEPIISATDGKVVEVVDRYRDNPPGELDQDLTLQDAGGNHVIVAIGGGKYALYAHLKPNSIRVQVGDRVRKGQQLGQLGNSGNTSAPHLHFHVMDAPLPLGAEHNLPYVIDSFLYQGFFDDNLQAHLLETPDPREDELPLSQSVEAFPAAEED